MHHSLRSCLPLFAACTMCPSLLACGSDAGLLLAERLRADLQPAPAPTPPSDQPAPAPTPPNEPSPRPPALSPPTLPPSGEEFPCSGQLISTDAVWEMVQRDLSSQLDEEDRLFARYLSLTNQFNAGRCSDGSAMGVYRSALDKALNSLSDMAAIVRAQPIDSNRLIYRIDIRDYGWDFPVTVDDGIFEGGAFRDKWEAIVGLSETAVLFQGDQAHQIQRDAFTDVPILMADAFIARATMGNLYYALANIPSSLDQLLLNLQIERRLDQDQKREWRAGITRSRVSLQGRVVARNETRTGPQRAVWQAFDLLAGSEEGSIFVNAIETAYDSSVALFTLNNGLFGYAMYDDLGNRLEESAILIDPAQSDFVARTAVSCSGCHAQGILQVTDEVAPFALENPLEFNNDDLESILDLYDQTAFDRAVVLDNQVYQAALSLTGTALDSPDPIQTVALRFDQDLDLNLVAAELGLSPGSLLEALPSLDPSLQELANGGTIARRDFTPQFFRALCIVSAASTNRPDDVECFEATEAHDR